MINSIKEFGRKITNPFVKINDFFIDVRDREIPMTMGAVIGVVFQGACVFACLAKYGFSIATVFIVVLAHMLAGFMAAGIAFCWELITAGVGILTYLPRYINQVCSQNNNYMYSNGYSSSYKDYINHQRKQSKKKGDYSLWYFIKKSKKTSATGLKYISL